jgi:signal transduction histidine kinase
MRLYGSGDHAAAADLVRSGVLDLGAQRIHDQLEHITRADTEARGGLRTRLNTALQAGRWVVLGGSLLAFALAVTVNLSLMRALRDREAAQQLVVTQSQQLRRQTDSLLEHEQQLGEQLRAHQQLSAALQRSNEELDRFAYATSHDLKAPLRGIMNIANWVEDDLGVRAAPEVKHNLGLLRSRARRLETLIEGILRYSRAGRVHDKPESVDVGTLVAEIVELIAPPPDCHVNVSGLPKLITERVPLQQVLMNLIQNAVKHGCPENRGEIEVSAEPVTDALGRMWRFRVRDHGPGIAAQFHERIFGIFESLAPRDVVEGAGIGLTVVQRLVETRGGKVHVESELGAGASFFFTWPGEVA